MTLSLERRADLWGDRTAVVDAGDHRRVSYADLDAEAEEMARTLSAVGVEPGDPVAVVSRNRVETLALLFAVRRLGAVLAPISHRLTPATVGRPVETVDPEVVVHEAAQRDLVRELPDETTRSFEELGRAEGEEYERADPDPEDSLLYLHTRDEADRPAVGEDEGRNRRGETVNEDPRTAERVVDLPERTVEWNCITAAAAWGLGRDDCAPTLLPFSDTDGLHRLTLPLLYVGGRVVVLRAFDPENALTAVEREGATALFAGATEYRELVGAEGFDATDFGSVEWFGTRSALPADAREALTRHAPLCRSYGRVETGPNDLYRPPEGVSGTSEPSQRDADPDCVGRPFPDCEVRIVGEEEHAPGDGREEVGELELRGPVTARGYLDGEEFCEWVPTGDLAYREDGDYYLLGLVGETVESEAKRVHPRTVERALTSHDGVTAAGAVGDSGEVVAAVVGEADPGELRTFVAERLSDAAVPREIVAVESLPRRPTGEPDRTELRRQFEDEERIGKE